MREKISLPKETLEEIVQYCRNTKEKINDEQLRELEEQLSILQEIVTNKEITYSEKSKEYWDKAKMDKAYYLGGTGEDIETLYTKALHAITSILDILRGEPLTITVQKIMRNSKNEIVDIQIIQGKEKDLSLKYNSKFKSIEYDLETTKENLLNIQKANKAYIHHYAEFYEMADEFISRTRSGKKNHWRKRVNEGHIVEAFQRHMSMRHNAMEANNTIYLDKINKRDLIILLYYSIGNTPWWQQGDIGYMQIKANNLQLASISSIQRVATKILQLFSSENFNALEFRDLFTAKDQKELLDITKLTEKELNELYKEIKDDKRFRNITMNLFKS